jgi:hypothetical protein
VANVSANHTTGGQDYTHEPGLQNRSVKKREGISPATRSTWRCGSTMSRLQAMETTSTSVTSLVTSVAGVFGGVSGGSGRNDLQRCQYRVYKFWNRRKPGRRQTVAYLNYIPRAFVGCAVRAHGSSIKCFEHTSLTEIQYHCSKYSIECDRFC